MKLANVSGRAAIVMDGEALDVATASGDRFGPDLVSVYEQWEDFRDWAEAASGDTTPIDSTTLGAPSPMPRQVIAVGANYKVHVADAGFDLPTSPVVFTKFQSCLTGPNTTVTLPAGNVDWEAELVLIVGRGGFRIPRDQGWDALAGVTVGQDLSERVSQLAWANPQFSMAKSFPGFGPTGPFLATADEFADPDDIGIRCDLNGERRQDFRTNDLAFDVSAIVHELSKQLTLYPGDVIFTGTSGGCGMLEDPPVFLQPGDELVTTIDEIGTLTQRFVTDGS